MKEKSFSIKSKAASKKDDKIELLYIPNTTKEVSHKSFKKTDKSIQWSEVDMSMYGKTNTMLNNHNDIQFIIKANR